MPQSEQNAGTYVRPLSTTGWNSLNPVLVKATACKKCKRREPQNLDKPCISGLEIPEFTEKEFKGKDGLTKYKVVKLPRTGKAVPGHGHQMVETGGKAPIPILSGPGEFRRNPIKRLIGYEIECGQHYDGAAITALAREYGADLHGDGGDFEFNPPPMNGDKLIEHITKISQKLRQYGAVATTSSGLHTHIDCRDLSWEEMRKVCVLYGKTEDGLYSIIDPRRFGANSRDHGHFCRPIGGPNLVSMMSNPITAKKDIIGFVFGNVENMKASRGQGKSPAGGERYLGLNLYSWWIRGTIEFRMHHGTTRAEKMINWGMLLAGMVESAVNRPSKEIDNWPTGKAGMLAYAPTQEVKDWVNKRWDYFAAKRKDKNKPALVYDIVPQSAVNKNLDTYEVEGGY